MSVLFWFWIPVPGLSRSHNSLNHLAQIYTIGSFYAREGRSWNSRVQQVSAEAHWQSSMGKLRADEHLPAWSLAQSGAMISSLFQALHLVGTGGKKLLPIFYRYCACRAEAGFRSLHSFTADIRIANPVEPHWETLVSSCRVYLVGIRPWFFSHSALLISHVILLKPVTLKSSSPCLWNGNTPETSFSTFLIT